MIHSINHVAELVSELYYKLHESDCLGSNQSTANSFVKIKEICGRILGIGHLSGHSNY